MLMLGFESIGDTHIQARRRIVRGSLKLTGRKMLEAYRMGSRPTPWASKIIGLSGSRLLREFLKPLKSYEDATTSGSRGVKYWFVFDDGVYEVYKHVSWSSSERFFIRVLGGSFTKVTLKEVLSVFETAA